MAEGDGAVCDYTHLLIAYQIAFAYGGNAYKQGKYGGTIVLANDFCRFADVGHKVDASLAKDLAAGAVYSLLRCQRTKLCYVLHRRGVAAGAECGGQTFSGSDGYG